MKVFRLACAQGHDFEGWFASAEAFEDQRAAGHVRCPVCGESGVSRLPSAPYVNTGARGTQTLPVASPAAAASPELATALAALKTFVETNTENVGRQFPEVARRIHYGEEERRGIRGRVTPEEAAELAEEGVDALALPPGLVLDEGVH
ncbi:MAG: DUF1178 family protein [Betaproteobacteria bacterium]|nr:DUF1178 family protein [Betaproteobacteria bacterium]PWB59588.1 MAG: DUF1178 domain-containing protein [Betaproteobacteria bacterium]